MPKVSGFALVVLILAGMVVLTAALLAGAIASPFISIYFCYAKYLQFKWAKQKKVIKHDNYEFYRANL